MALEFTYRIISDIPWADVAESPDKIEVSTIGQDLIAQGNHTVSLPVDIDTYTREWTLTFSSYQAWEAYNEAIVIDENVINPGFTAFVISTPTQ